jgi:PhzF family phenazine biosynthesis protein
MKLRMYQIDAFADRLFRGNPAAVCPMRQWLPSELMQQIAAENNLSETAFVVRGKDRHEIRWFTPTVEVDLCGHATLASGYALFNLEGANGASVEFGSRSGTLAVRRSGDLLTLDFPADGAAPVSTPEPLAHALGAWPLSAYRGRDDYLLVFPAQRDVEQIKPDFGLLSGIDARGIIITAKGDETDFVSRFFAPRVGVNEDPVTGSSHTLLTPYWAARLGKTELTAAQLSKRGGWLRCRLAGKRVHISGKARLYLEGWIDVEEALL